MEGETRQHWFPLMGQAPNANENQGDILIIMSFEVHILLNEVKNEFSCQ